MSEIKFINLTPHALNIEGIGEIPPSGEVLRVEETTQRIGEIAGVEVVRRSPGRVELPPVKDGVVYLVSYPVLEAMRRMGVVRHDVVAPDTSPESAIRDADGRIIGVRRLAGI